MTPAATRPPRPRGHDAVRHARWLKDCERVAARLGGHLAAVMGCNDMDLVPTVEIRADPDRMSATAHRLRMQHRDPATVLDQAVRDRGVVVNLENQAGCLWPTSGRRSHPVHASIQSGCLELTRGLAWDCFRHAHHRYLPGTVQRVRRGLTTAQRPKQSRRAVQDPIVQRQQSLGRAVSILNPQDGAISNCYLWSQPLSLPCDRGSSHRSHDHLTITKRRVCFHQIGWGEGGVQSRDHQYPKTGLSRMTIWFSGHGAPMEVREVDISRG
jgi:hypothetical protein